MIKTIFFDAGDTLIKMQPSARQIFRGVLEEFGIVTDEKKIRLGYEAAEKYYRDFFFTSVERVGAISRLSEEERKKVWTRYNLLVLKAAGVEGNTLKLAQAINDRFEDRVGFVAFPETEEVLKRLKGYTLAVISNWNLKMKIQSVFDGLGLSRYFSFLIASCEVGYDKPRPEIFRIALEKASALPQEAIHVGDSFEADVTGAQKVGMRPLLVDRSNNSHSYDCTKIQSLSEILQHLT